MSLQGNLTDLPFEDLLQVFTVQNKCGILFVHNNQYEAEVCFKKTALHSALIYRTDQIYDGFYREGLEAVFELLRWEEGEFHFEMESIPPTPANIHTTVDYIILESYRQRDEQERLPAARSLVHLVPSPVANPPYKAQINLELDQWQLLLQINGFDTVEQIAQRLRQDVAKVTRIIQELENKGLIEFTKTQTESSKTFAPTVQSGQYDKTGASYGFDAKLEISYQYHFRGTTYNNQMSPPSPVANSNVILANPCAFDNGNGTRNGISQKPFINTIALPAPAEARIMEQAVIQDAKPKVKRGLLSGIMAKIRGL